MFKKYFYIILSFILFSSVDLRAGSLLLIKENNPELKINNIISQLASQGLLIYLIGLLCAVSILLSIVMLMIQIREKRELEYVHNLVASQRTESEKKSWPSNQIGTTNENRNMFDEMINVKSVLMNALYFQGDENKPVIQKMLSKLNEIGIEIKNLKSGSNLPVEVVDNTEELEILEKKLEELQKAVISTKETLLEQMKNIEKADNKLINKVPAELSEPKKQPKLGV
jgi:hypothetical protein